MLFLRLLTKAGIVKLKIDDVVLTCNELYDVVRDKFNNNIQNFLLSLDSDYKKIIEKSDNLLTKSYHLTNGQNLYIKTDEEIIIDAEKVKSINKKLTAELVDNSNNNNNFISFEAYLKLNKYNCANLPLNNTYRQTKINSGQATKIPPPITLKRQQYRHIDHIELMNTDMIYDFTERWMNDENLNNYAALLIGYYVKDSNFGIKDTPGVRAVVENIYQPKQTYSIETNEINIDDNELPQLYALLEKIDMHVVGIAFTHYHLDHNIPPDKFINLAKFQLEHLSLNIHYTGYPINSTVILTISFEDDNDQPTYNAFSISDLGLALVRDDMLQISNNQLIPKQSTEDVLLPEILENGKRVEQIDCDWFLVRVIESASSKPIFKMPKQSFPYYNQTEKHFQKFMQAITTNDGNELCDINFMFFIAKIIGLDSVQYIIDYINEKKEIPDNYFDLLRSVIE